MAPRGAATDHLITLDEAAERLGVRDSRTARRHFARRGVAIVRIGRAVRVRSSDVDELIEAAGQLEAPSSEKRAPEHGADPLSRGDRNAPTPAPGERELLVKGDAKKRGWRESVEKGLYRAHRVACKASTTKRAGCRCSCPWQTHVPTDVPGRTRLATFEADNLTEARKQRLSLKSDAHVRAPESGGSVTLDEFFHGIFLDKRDLAPSSVASYRSIYKHWIAPKLGKLRLCDITPEHVDGWLKFLAAEAERQRTAKGKRNPQFVGGKLRALKSIFAAATKWRRISSNPTTGARAPACGPVRDSSEVEEGNAGKVLQEAELERLFDVASRNRRERLAHRNPVLLRTTFELALRVGETCGLRWEDFDFDARTVAIVRQFDKVAKECRMTKGKSRRVLTFRPALATYLEEWRDFLTARGEDPNGFVFPRPDGGPLTTDTPREVIEKVQTEADLLDDRGRPRIVFHGLRHTSASLLLCRGVPLLKVSRFLGHSSVRVTEEVYAHLLDQSELDEIADVFDASCGRASGQAGGGGGE